MRGEKKKANTEGAGEAEAEGSVENAGSEGGVLARRILGRWGKEGETVGRWGEEGKTVGEAVSRLIKDFSEGN